MPHIKDRDGGSVLFVGSDADAVATRARREVIGVFVVSTEDEGVGGGVG